MNMVNTPCMICRAKNAPSYKINKLRQLLSFISAGIEPSDSQRGDRIPWDISEKCKYGLYCQNLSRLEVQMGSVTEDINRYLYTVIEIRDSDKYHRALECTRGDFSRTYICLTRMWAEEEKHD